MSYQIDKATGDVVIKGWEYGISPSPHQGIGNMQGVNTSTESGEVMASYARTLQSQANLTSTGSVAALDASHVTLSIANGVINAGVWITVSGSTITNLANGTYYVTANENGNTQAQLSTSYGGSVLSTLGVTGTASFTILRQMSQPIAYAIESHSIGQYRYFVLDSAGLVWVYDTAIFDSSKALSWFLPDTTLLTAASGITVLNGFLGVAANNSSPTTSQTIWFKSTSLLGASPGWTSFVGGPLSSRAASLNPHFMLVGNQSTLYYTDGNFVGSIFPTSGTPNIFSYCSYTASTTTGTISSLIGGTLPTVGSASTRIPAVFFTGGTKPTAITVGTIYYIAYSAGLGTFEVFAAASGGAAIDIETGSVGTQYFNTFYPIHASATATYVWTPQALTLPFNEVAQSMAELGNTVVVGCKTNVVYQWDQVAPQASGFVYLPESNVVNIITVNNMGYAFAGSRGNIYVTNGSTASLAIKVPDYTSGIVEPYFVWGGAAFMRGRVYFSIQDQFSGHTGQCGGVWSFIPTENYSLNGDNTGSGLRIENQNSYATYNGRATIIIPNRDQAARGPQYWAGWISNAVSSPTYGIDVSSTSASTAGVIETDIIPIGTFLNKGTIKQVEYKVAADLASGDTITIKYRTTLSGTFASLDTKVTEATNALSAYFPANFQQAQWVQFQITLQPSGASDTSFCRLTEVRMR